MKNYKHLLVIRFSSFGDVVLTIPVIYNLLEKNPLLHISILTKSTYADIFQLLDPTRVTILGVEPKEINGVFNLYKLYKKVSIPNPIDAVIDLHNVIRSRVLGFFFKFNNIPFHTLNKRRSLKKKFLADSLNVNIPSIWSQYQEVFLTVGLDFSNSFSFLFKNPARIPKNFELEYKKPHFIAIAPFAAFKEKTFPLEKMEQLICLLNKIPTVQIGLLGKGNAEEAVLNNWKDKYPDLILLSSYTLLEQIQILSVASIALVMDSANLHLAGIAQTKYIFSIWGATSPKAGFNVWKNNIVIEKNVACRPCSIFGNKKCSQNELYCLQINVQDIYTMILQKIT